MKKILWSLIISAALGCGAAVPLAAQESFEDFCFQAYERSGLCPEICRLECVGDKKDCVEVCLPIDCPEIAVKECPVQFCVIMQDCSGDEVCHFQMEGELAPCGDLSYAGQDVPCCAGFVRRCGIQFLDNSCDLEGKYSVYSIPICIPCGDGDCTQFENICNCPEDCGEGEYQGEKFDKEKEEEEKRKEEEKKKSEESKKK